MVFFADDFFSAQIQTPLLETLVRLANQSDAAFYAPGHKRGQGINQNLANLLGKSVFRADLPELPELDNLFAPNGVIEVAQTLAAQAYGASQTRFLVNGSTCGVIAAILATCQTGDKIILPRNVHRSAIAGLILSGAMPIFVNPAYNQELDLVYSITPKALETALEQHPDTRAVMIVYPTYHGICGDLEAMISITNAYDIPLLVDQAHGAHFAFHEDLPPCALSLGADLTIQSTHKVLGALTQASMLHIQGKRIDPQRLSKTLQLVQTTSPSYLLLASLDAARQQMALQGHELLTKTLKLAAKARKEIGQMPGLSVLELQSPQPSFRWLDQTRLTVNVSQIGFTGYEVDEILHQELGVTAELPMLNHLTFIITFGNKEEDIDQLIRAFKTLTTLTPSEPLTFSNYGNTPLCPPPLAISPRDAFFAPTETISINKSIGYVCAELVCPYPPGIPLLMPGEIITQEAITYLGQVLTLGGTITGCSDPSVSTLRVIRTQRPN